MSCARDVLAPPTRDDRFAARAALLPPAAAGLVAVERDHAVGGPLGTPITGIGRKPLGRHVLARAVRQGG